MFLATSSPAEDTQDPDIERFLQVALAEDSTVVVWKHKDNDEQKLWPGSKQKLARFFRMSALRKWHYPPPNPDAIPVPYSPTPDFAIDVYRPEEGSEKVVRFAKLCVFFPERGRHMPPLELTFYPDRLHVTYDVFTQQVHEFAFWLEYIKDETEDRWLQEVFSQ